MEKNGKKPRLRFNGFTETWEQRKAKDICNIGTGKSNTQDQVEDGIYPFYIRSDIPVKSNKYLYDCEAVITIGDGNIGRVFHYVNGKFDLHQRCYKMTDFQDIWGKYFYYFFSTRFYDRAMKMTAKATVDSVRLEMISEMDIFKPKQIEEQKKIAEFFTNLDRLITLHQRKHDKFIAIKKALLEKVFPKKGSNVPEFRLNGYEKPWQNKTLGEIGTTYTGLSGKIKEDFGHGNAQFITYLNVFKNPIADVDGVDFVEIDATQNTVKSGDVLFTTSSETPDEVGMSSVWLGDMQNTYLNSFCFGYRLFSSEKIDPLYLAYLLRSPEIRKEFQFLAQGISRYNISKTKVMDIVISVPEDYEEQVKIGKLFFNFDKLIELTQKKYEKLESLKKALLNKMFV